MLNAGDLRHRGTIQAPVNVRDEHGGVIQSWFDVTARWMRIEALNGKEIRNANQTASLATHRITMRFYAELTSKHRVSANGHVYNLVSAVDPDGRREATEALGIEAI
jgi:SPP1 family predicted phage head-tail adaptor